MGNNENYPRRTNYGETKDSPAINAESFKSWIKDGANRAMVDFAEKAGAFMARNGLTSSQIRNFYGEIKRIQIGDFENERASFCLLKPKVAYAVSRQNNKGILFFQKAFIEAWGHVETKGDFDNFCSLMEAMLAYHKANNGK